MPTQTKSNKSQAIPEEIVVLSHDYDGCFDIHHDGWVQTAIKNYEKYIRRKLTRSETDAIRMDYSLLVANYRMQHRAFLKEATEGATKVKIYVGSDRQSYRLDKLNDNHNSNGSVFKEIPAFCASQNIAEKNDHWSFEPLLMADPKDPDPSSGKYARQTGKAYALIQSGVSQDKQLNTSHADMSMFHSKMTGRMQSSKYPMLLTQMWHAHRQNPHAKIKMYFVDDRKDLMRDLKKRLKASDIPPNIELSLTIFDYSAYKNQAKFETHTISKEALAAKEATMEAPKPAQTESSSWSFGNFLFGFGKSDAADAAPETATKPTSNF